MAKVTIERDPAAMQAEVINALLAGNLQVLECNI
jgi:hypothetical protein